jgi:hypothetical protein
VITFEDDGKLARHRTVRELVGEYEIAMSIARRSFEALATAQTKLSEAFGPNHRTIYIGDANRLSYRDWSFDDDIVNNISAQVWRALIEHLEIRRFMSVRAWQDLEKQIKENKMPPITYESVMQVMESFQANHKDLATQAVEEVFDRLRVRDSHYKTNSEYQVGRKVILAHMVELDPLRGLRGRGGFWRLHWQLDQEMTALENVFTLLDGGNPRIKNHKSDLHTAIVEAGEDGRGETKFFRFRCFKNQNLHLEFKDLELVARLNRVAGGKRLRHGENESRA